MKCCFTCVSQPVKKPPLCLILWMDMSYMLPLLVGLLKGLGEDFYIGGPFGFGLWVCGDVETDLHRTNR